MIFSENRFALFRIMHQMQKSPQGSEALRGFALKRGVACYFSTIAVNGQT
jgi:hypothetical protein